MDKSWQEKKGKNRKETLREKERLDFEKFVKQQLTRLKEMGLSIPIATL